MMSKADIEIIDAVVRWVTSLAGAFLVPVVALALLIYLVRSEGAPERIKRLLEPVSSFKFLGQEFVLTHPDQVTSSAEATFRAYRSETKLKYDALVKELRIVALHERLVRDVLGPAIGGIEKAADFRSTVHVIDTLFAESYYQLIPYFPAGGGSGRSWSIRYGIVGRTWRQGRSNGEGDLKMSKADLTGLWGMTEDEAEKAKQARPSLLAVVLRDGTNKEVGVFFADSSTVNAFGEAAPEWTAVAAHVERGARSIGLTAALSAMVAALPREPLVPMLAKERA
jgi:hypothetical protein